MSPVLGSYLASLGSTSSPSPIGPEIEAWGLTKGQSYGGDPMKGVHSETALTHRLMFNIHKHGPQRIVMEDFQDSTKTLLVIMASLSRL